MEDRILKRRTKVKCSCSLSFNVNKPTSHSLAASSKKKSHPAGSAEARGIFILAQMQTFFTKGWVKNVMYNLFYSF